MATTRTVLEVSFGFRNPGRHERTTRTVESICVAPPPLLPLF
jgi:hypothetical protein